MQLSYGGTLGIILFNKILEKKIKLPRLRITNKFITTIKQMMIVSISANLIIFPIVAMHYNTISLTFFISNILAGPILGIIIILGFITIFISFISIQISKIPAIVLSIFIQLLIQIANFTSGLPLSKIYVKTPSIFAIILYYIILSIVIYLIKYRNTTCFCIKNQQNTEKIIENNETNFYRTTKQKRFERIILNKLENKELQKNIIVVILIIIIILFQLAKLLPSTLKIYFIDVGQGDCTLIITPNHKTILIDGGGNETNDNYDIGKNTLIPYLLDRGITKLDYIFISHFDFDHVRTGY